MEVFVVIEEVGSAGTSRVYIVAKGPELVDNGN